MSDQTVAKSAQVNAGSSVLPWALTEQTFSAIVVAIIMGLAGWAAIYWWAPPTPASAQAPAGEFSAERAASHLAVIARAPRPIGSAHAEYTRRYIVDRLTELGLRAEALSGVDVSNLQVTYVQNILASLPGIETGPGVLLSAHYDSVPNSPGASDDGVGVASLLETARALRSGAPPRRSVHFLFTDGEEAGLCGAKAFAATHPITDLASFVVNLDARGSTGPGLMFETGATNGTLLRAYAKAVPLPIASSLGPELYKLVDNDTDFTVFNRAGASGFNFALVDGLLAYHTGTDLPENLDARSLQHLGDSMLGIARNFASQPPPSQPATDQIYFNAGPWLAVYSSAWAAPLSMIALGLLLAAVVLGIRKQRIVLREFLIGILVFPLISFLTAALSTLVWGGILLLHGQYRLLPYGETYNAWLYRAAMSAFAVLITILLYDRVLRKRRSESLWAAILFVCCLYSLFLNGVAPGASYLVIWPAIAGLVGLLISLLMDWTPGSRKNAFVLALCSIPAIVLLIPAIRLLYWVFTLGFLAPAVFLLTICCGLLLPQLEALRAWRRESPVLIAGAIFLIFCVAGGFTSAPSKSTPSPSGMLYAAIPESRTAYWMNPSARADAWNQRLLGASPGSQPCASILPGRPGQCLVGGAQYAELAPPIVEVIENTNLDASRQLRLRVSSPRQAPELNLRFDQSVEILYAEVNGQSLDLQSSRNRGEEGTNFRFLGSPDHRVEMVIRLKSQQAVPVIVSDRSYGLETMPGFIPRPSDLIPAGPDSDSVFVITRMNL